MNENSPERRVIIFGARHGGMREVAFVVGHFYECKPSNPRATKNRGRRGELVGFAIDEGSSMADAAKIRWQDSGRIVDVAFCDLLPL